MKIACQVEAYPAQNLTVKWTYADQAETDAVVEKEISRYVKNNHIVFNDCLVTTLLTRMSAETF